MHTVTSDSVKRRPRHQTIGLWGGPLCALVMLATGSGDMMPETAWHTAAIGLWMAIWWGTEAVPIAVTAFLPLVMFAPLGITTIKAAAAPYAHPIIYLFLGSFLLAQGLQRWQLHQRIALGILTHTGTGARSLIGGFMSAAALISMWMTNTATTIMLFSIVISVIHVVSETIPDTDERELKNFRICLLLGIAFGASIGGMATLIGTPPNALLAAFIEETYDIKISFVRWLLVGLPVSFIMLPLAWLVLTRLAFPIPHGYAHGAHEQIARMRNELGAISTAEKRIGCLFLLLILGWLTRPLLAEITGLPGLSDAGIAMTVALLLFLVPHGMDETSKHSPLLDWSATRELPWSILILFGGGLSLAAAISQSGLALWLGDSLEPIGSFGLFTLLVSIVALVVFLTECTSNTATTATLLPVMAVLAIQLGYNPLQLAAPVALAASCAFMLPVATVPNAIVYASGMLTIPQMIRAGFILNLLSIALISLAALFLVPLLFS